MIAPGPTDAEETTPFGKRIFVRAPNVPGSGGYRMILQPRRLFDLLDSLQPDAVEVSDKLTLVAAARWAGDRGIRCTLLSHERIDAILARRVPGFVALGRAADAWNRRLARTFDAVVCPSRFALEEFDRIRAANTALVPWGVDLETFVPDADRGARATRRAAIELICVGRLSKEKEPELAVEAVSELWGRRFDAHLTMVGTGPMLGRLQHRARGLPVTFAGHVHGRREVASLLAAADVALAPCRGENFGLSVLEAMACGTPVVTATSGAAFEVCGPEAGMAAPPDGPGIARAGVDLLDGDRPALSRAARGRAERFPWTRAAGSVLAVHLGDRQRAGQT